MRQRGESFQNPSDTLPTALQHRDSIPAENSLVRAGVPGLDQADQIRRLGPILAILDRLDKSVKIGSDRDIVVAAGDIFDV